MNYDEFAAKFLAALHLETEQTGRPHHSANEIIEKYQLQPKPHWIARMADEWEHSYFKNLSRVMGGYDQWSFKISAEGSRKVESEFSDEVSLVAFLTQQQHGGAQSNTVLKENDKQTVTERGGGAPSPIDSTNWTGSRLILVDDQVIAEVKAHAHELREAVYALHLPSNSESVDLQKLADALVLICEMAQPEVSIIDRILASPKFKMYAGLLGVIATIRGAIGL